MRRLSGSLSCFSGICPVGACRVSEIRTVTIKIAARDMDQWLGQPDTQRPRAEQDLDKKESCLKAQVQHS